MPHKIMDPANYQLLEAKDWDLDEAAALVTAAFRQDPLYLFLTRSSRADRLRALIRTLIQIHRRGAGLQWALVAPPQLCGVALVLRPGEAAPFGSVLGRLLTFALVQDPVLVWRLVRYLAKTHRHRPQQPHYYLLNLAVHPEFQGQGHGRALLAEIHRRSEQDPASTGVALDTENPANLPFYEHLGPVDIFYLFRKNGSAA